MLSIDGKLDSAELRHQWHLYVAATAPDTAEQNAAQYRRSGPLLRAGSDAGVQLAATSLQHAGALDGRQRSRRQRLHDLADIGVVSVAGEQYIGAIVS